MSDMDRMIIKAVAGRNSKAAGAIHFQMKYNQGMSYEQIYEKVNSVLPISMAEWDGLLYESGM